MYLLFSIILILASLQSGDTQGLIAAAILAVAQAISDLGDTIRYCNDVNNKDKGVD